MTLFDPTTFDLDGYAKRIGFGGHAAPERGRPASSRDSSMLRELTLLHVCAIPFENLNPLFRRPVPLDLASIQQKLVRGGRGGWCYEHNLLFGTALTAFGFTVTGLSARVAWNSPPGAVRARSHMVLLVTLDEAPFIVDVGFGGPTPTAPLRVETGVEQATPHGPHRLTSTDWGLLLESKFEDEWKALYTVDLQPQVLADYEMPNWYLCHHPESHFLAGLVAARAEVDRRYALRNADLTTYFPDGVTERRTLSGAAEMRRALHDVFHVNVPDWADVDRTLERLALPGAP